MTTSRTSTLLDLVQTVSDCAANDHEIVATVAYLINSGKVLLCGNFAGAKIDVLVPASAAPQASAVYRKLRQKASCAARQ